MTEWRFSCTASPSPKEHGQEERSEFKAQATLGIKISFITSPTCFSLWVSSGSSRTAQISQPCFPQVNSPSYGGFVWLQTFPVCLSCRRSVAVTVCQKTAFTQILKTAYPEVINLNSSELLCAPSGTSLIRSHKQRKVKTLPGILPIHEQVAPFLRSAQPNTLSGRPFQASSPVAAGTGCAHSDVHTSWHICDCAEQRALILAGKYQLS